MIFKKKESKVNTKEKTIQEKALELYPIKIEEVYGYKAVDKNLKSFQGDYQYSIDKPNTYDGELIICNSGLHFCPELTDLYDYCEPCNSRIFKVRAKVDINSENRDRYIYNEENKDNYYGRFYYAVYNGKLISDRIIFVEELSDIDIYNAFEHKFDKNIISSFEDFEEYRFCGDLKSKKLNKMKADLISAGYTKLFSDVFIDNVVNKDFVNYALYNLALTYMAEGLSKEMAVYLLMK